MTRTGILLWSAATGLVVGLVAGVTLLAVVTIAAHLVPSLPERLVERWRVPIVVLLLAVLPLAAAVVGYLEGRAKLP